MSTELTNAQLLERENLTNAQLFERAQKVIPGGVNSPVRAFRAVGGTPRFIKSGHGAYIVAEPLLVLGRTQ